MSRSPAEILALFPSTFLSFLIAFSLGVVFWVAGLIVVSLITPHSELALLRAGNTPCALAFGGKAIGMVLPIAAVARAAASPLDQAIWCVVAVAVQLCALNLQSVTGGPFGISFIPRPFGDLAGMPLAFSLLNLGVLLLIVGGLYLILEQLARSPWGRVLRAIREDETAAQALGKNTTMFRLQAFALGGGIMGLAGAVQGGARPAARELQLAPRG